MRRPRLPLLAAVAILGSACSAEIPDATYVCNATGDCPPGLVCDTGRRLCVRPFDGGTPSGDAGPCEPRDCAGLRAQCGMIDDGCGTAIDCGECTAPETCGGGGIANICDCEPQTCADLGATCGELPNGCGGTLRCGACDAPETCGGGGVDNECGCTAADPCPGLCGDQIDDCGVAVACPECTVVGESCGAVTPNMCGVGSCVPLPTSTVCVDAGLECGPTNNNCGESIDCGACRAPETCGGAAVTGLCGCSPRSCDAPTMVECGMVPDGCGADLSCGICPESERCNASNLCECAPDSGEANEDEATAHPLGTLPRPLDETYTAYTLHDAGDRDFFALTVTGTSAAGGPRLDVDLTVPPGADYDLGVWIDCGGLSTGDRFSCLSGTINGSHLQNGCIASTGASTEVVSMNVPCQSFDVLIGINASGSAAVCAPYTLRVRTDT